MGEPKPTFGAYNYVPHRQFWLTVLIVIAAITATAQTPQIGVRYDARQFLSVTERNTFRKLYPQFDKPRVEKNWKWKDVDPLGIYSPEENRRRRRELFLFEYSSVAPPDEDLPTEEQQALEPILRKQLSDATVLMGRNTIKIVVPYTERYEGKIPSRNLIEKTARLGLQWAELGGVNLYIYNGPVLMSRYKSGYVSLADRDIDQPIRP